MGREGERDVERGGTTNGKRGRERMSEGLMETGREVMSLRAEPLEAAWSAAALKQACTYAHTYSVCLCASVCVEESDSRSRKCSRMLNPARIWC